MEGNGEIEFVDFLVLLGLEKPRVASEKKKDALAKKLALKAAEEKERIFQKLLEYIRRKLEEHLGSSENPALVIRETFAEIDSDESNSIDKSEFLQAMNVLAIPISSEELEQIFERYDTEKIGAIQYVEFLSLLGYKSEFDKLVDTIRTKLEENL